MNQTKTQIMMQCNDIVEYYIQQIEYHYINGRKKEARCLHKEIQQWIQEKEDYEVITLEYLNDYLDKI